MVHRHLPQSQRMAGEAWRAPCPTPPSMSPLSSLGDQYLKNTQNHPTWRMRAVPHPGNLLFSPPRKHRAHSGKAMGCSQAAPHHRATIPPQESQTTTVLSLQPCPTETHIPPVKLLYFHPVSPPVQKVQNMKKIGFFVPPTPLSLKHAWLFTGRGEQLSGSSCTCC